MGDKPRPIVTEDERVRTFPYYAPRTRPAPIPAPGIFDEPVACIRVNRSWVPHLLGVLAALDEPDTWQGTESEIWNARQQIRGLMVELMHVCEPPPINEEDQCVAYLPRDSRVVTSIEPNNPFTGTGDVPDLWNSPPMLRGDQVDDPIGVIGALDTDLVCWPLDIEMGLLEFVTNILTLEWEIPRVRIEWDGPATVELHLLTIVNGGYCVIVPDSVLDTDVVLLQSVTMGSFFEDLLGLIDALIDASLYGTHIYEYQTSDPGPHKIDLYFIPFIETSLDPFDLLNMGWGGGLRKVVICQDDISITPCDDCPDCPDMPEGPGTPWGDDGSPWGQWPDGGYINAGIGGGCCSDESEDCMANLGPCPPIRIQDGVLQFFWCCQWVDIGNVSDIGIPQDPEPPEIEDPQLYYACGKADAVVELIYAFAGAAWDLRANPHSWDNIGYIARTVGYSPAARAANEAVRFAYVLDDAGVQEEAVFNDDQKQLLKCRIASIVGDDYGGIDDEDFREIQSFVLSQWLGQAPQLFWLAAVEMTGKTNCDTVAKIGSTNPAANCACPEGDTLEIPVSYEWLYDWDLTENPYGFDVISGSSWVSGEGYTRNPFNRYDNLPRIQKQVEAGRVGTLRYVRMDFVWPECDSYASIEWFQDDSTTVWNDPGIIGSDWAGLIVNRGYTGLDQWSFWDGQGTMEGTIGAAKLQRIVLAGNGQEPYPSTNPTDPAT